MAPTRFVADAALERVARRLRILGYDVAARRGARLEELFVVAAREGRVMLTASVRHPRRWGAVPVLRVPLADPAAAVRAVAEAHEPSGPPLSRCPYCNVIVRARSPFEAHGEVPGRVVRAGGALTSCPECGRWFWPGSHVARLAAWLEAALGRPVPGLPARERPAG